MEPVHADSVLEPTVLFENDDVLVVDKPSGLVVHEDGRTDEYSVVDWVRMHHPYMEGVGEPQRLPNGTIIDRPGVVHRLDRDTSGVLVLAKNQAAFTHLKRQFQLRGVTKNYTAFVYGTFRAREYSGIITTPIGRSRGDFRQWAAGAAAKGNMREAVTHYRVIAENDIAACIELEPKTGRTHQIRVHLKSIGHPIVNDVRYAPKRPAVLGLSRLALHASAITLALPEGKVITVESPLPEDFTAALRLLSPVAA
jgi:23S rRNA pseudouridine1911/1915/1917 synthase